MDRIYIKYDKTNGEFQGFADEANSDTIEINDEVYKKLLFSNKICKINTVNANNELTFNLSVDELIIEEDMPIPPYVPTETDLLQAQLDTLTLQILEMMGV